MKSKRIQAVVIVVASLAVSVLAVLGGRAVSAQDTGQAKYTVRVPNGLAFSEFRGYEGWQTIAISHNEKLMALTLGNPEMINAYKSGIPGNGKPFPDGARLAKVEWRKVKSADAPYDIKVPGAIYDLDFMVKDSKRFPDGYGWGYAVFKWDAASNGYKPAGLDHVPPQENDAKCGVACHTIAKGKDHVFTTYARR